MYGAFEPNLTARTGVFEFSDIWDTVKDVVTDDTFWLLLGTFVTAGQAGWITGILTNAQQEAFRQTMNAVAGYVVPAVSCVGGAAYGNKNTQAYKDCLAKNANFLDAWKSQLVWRMKRTVELGGPQFAAQIASRVGTLTTAVAEAGPYAAKVRNAYVAARALYPNDIAAQKAEAFRQIETQCKAEHPSPVTVQGPDGSIVLQDLCRPDALAIAANFHLGENYFNPSDWDARTGRPVSPADFAPRARGGFRIPDLQRAIASARAAGLPSAVTDALEQVLATAIANRQRLMDLGIRPAPGDVVYTKPVDLHKDPAGNIIAGPPPPVTSSSPRVRTNLPHLARAALLASLVTVPLWLPFLVLPALRKRAATRTRRARK
jgi:hypothetical protein